MQYKLRQHVKACEGAAPQDAERHGRKDMQAMAGPAILADTPRPPGPWRAGVTCTAMSVLALLGGTVAVRGSAQDRLPEGDGRVTVESICASRCHNQSTILRAKRTPAGWEAIIDVMTERGAEMSDSEYYEILDYLSTHLLATVNVNTAPRERLVEVLEITDQQADAIVEGRKAHPLKTWQDVAKLLPDAKPSFVEERKARLVFE
jgi:hypothetical protein